MSYLISHRSISQAVRRSPASRSRQLSDGWQGMAQWFFQVHLVCTALDWLGRNVVEDPTRPNRGVLVDQIHLRYRGWDQATLEREWSKSRDGVGLAWCAEFVWVAVDDVCKKIGVANCLPGWSATLGRARDTLDKSRGSIPVISWQDLATGQGVTIKRTSGNIIVGKDGWPVVGQVFYRTSQPQRQGSDSTGHMGIVVSVKPDQGIFETIEGNQGTSNRVGLYQYTRADIKSYQFQFIHVAECAATKDTPSGVLSPSDDCLATATGRKRIMGGYVCPPGWAKNEKTQGCDCIAPKKIAANGDCISCDPPATWNETTRVCTSPPASNNAAPAQDCSISSIIKQQFSSLPPAEKQRVCSDVKFKDIDVGLLLHYSELKRKDDAGRLFVGADILGASYGIGGDRNAFFALRNGSAVNRKNASRDNRNDHTGLGIFKMRSGRLLYICAEGSLQWNNLWFNNLFGAGYGEGKEPWRIHIERIQGGSFGEEMAEVFASIRPINGPNAGAPRVAWVTQNGRQVIVRGGVGGGSIANLSSSEIPFQRLEEILDAIEKMGRAGESDDLSPVLISYNMNPIPWTKSVEQVIEVASVAITIAIPVAGAFASASVLGTLQTIKDDLGKLMKAVSGAQGGDMVALAVDLGATFLPSDYKQYVSPAKSAYRAVIGKNPSEAIKSLELLSRTDLGNQITQWGQQLVSGVNIDVGSIAKSANKSLDYVRQQIATYQVGQMIGTVAVLTASDVEFAKKLFKVDSKAISDVSYLSTFVTSLAGGKHPATVPNLGGLSRMVAMSGELTNMIEGKVEGARSDVQAVLSLLGMGFSAPCAVFRDLAYQSFRQQAERLRSSGVKTIATPSLLNSEDSECFAYRVRGDVSGLEVLYGEPKIDSTKVVTVGTGTTTVQTTRNDWNPVQVTNTPITPTIGLPNIGLPNIGLPNIGLPNIGLPNIGLPNGGLPNIGLPKVDIPRVDLPKVDVPTTVVPIINGPRFDVPIIDPPKIIQPQFDPPWGDSPVTTPPVVEPPTVEPPTIQFQNDWTPKVVVKPPECPPGFTLIGNECTPHPPTFRRQECPDGYTLMGNECVPPPPVIKRQDCPPGYLLLGNECVPPAPTIRPPQCPDGYTLVGNECIPPAPPVRAPTPDYPNDWNPRPPVQPPPVTPGPPPGVQPPMWPYGWPPYPPNQGGCGCGCCD